MGVMRIPASVHHSPLYKTGRPAGVVELRYASMCAQHVVPREIGRVSLESLGEGSPESESTGPSLRWHLAARHDMGSAALGERLRRSLHLLEHVLGVEVPKTCRARNALAFFDRLNDPGGSTVPVSDRSFEQELIAHDRTARELFTITYAACEDRRNPSTPFTRDKLRACLFGADIVDGRDAEARNTQFELIVAATLRLGCLSVYRGEPDLRCDILGERVGIAAKRVRSDREDTFEVRLDSAVEQIGNSGLPGYVAMNVDRRFEHIDPRAAHADLLAEIESVFNSIRYRKAAMDANVHGAMLFGWGAVLTPRPNDALPLLTVVSPARWERWSLDPETAERFDQFSRAWYDRMDRNTRFIMSPDVGSRPL
jgi:hypothetical protein